MMKHILVEQKSNEKEQKTRLPQVDFQKFIDGNMTANEMRGFKDKLNQRFIFIVTFYNQIFGHDIDYFCYSNATEYDNWGSFEPFGNPTELFFEISLNKESEYPILESIPYCWFYTDVTEHINEIIKEVNNAVKEELQLQQEQEQKDKQDELFLKKIHDTIKQKLTLEELATISFISLKDYKRNLNNLANIKKKNASKIVKKAKSLNINLSKKYSEYLKDFNKNQSNNKSNPEFFEDWVLKVDLTSI